MTRPSAFERRSMRIAGSFLHSAVILDDQAYPMEETVHEVGAIKVPEPFMADEIGDEGVSAAVVDAAIRGNNPIPTKDIVRAFAESGIICAILDPEEGMHECESLQPDITILDWYIRDKTGERARRLLSQLLSQEQAKHPHQVRLVLIYTTEQDLRDIREKIAKLLEGFKSASPVEFGETGLSWEGWHFIVLAKPGTPVPIDLSPLVVEYTDLPDRAVREFSAIVGGLMPNVAIAGLAAIRRNTHRILRRFSSSLDTPYLTHRALLPDPEDSEDHLLSLLGSEIVAILEDEEISEVCGTTAAKEWIKTQDLSFPLEVKCDGNKLELQDSRSLGSLFSKGAFRHPQVKVLKSDESAKERLVKKLRSKLTGFLGGQSASDAAFAQLTIFRPHYGSIAPKLSLGTVVSDETKDAYWLCVQPRCDSVRLTKPRQFLFLPLEEAGAFDMCLSRSDTKPLNLRRGRKPYLLTSYRFKPDGSGVVRARERDGHYEFMTAGRVRLRFEGQLRNEIAQDVAHKVATQLSRVGVNRSEWQRLSLPRSIRDQ